MTAPAQPVWTKPRPRWGPGRIIALLVGILLIVPGVGLLAAGGALFWADNSARTDGYVLSGTGHFSAPGYALSSDTLDLSTGASWLPVSAALGRARVQVTSDDGAAVFIGIAPVARAQAYLAGVGHTVVADIGTDSDLRAVAGGPPPSPPAAQDFWVAKTSGTGTQRLTWNTADGNWTLVVMKADGSAGLSVQARAGATAPALGGLAWTVLLIGVVVTLVGVLLIVLAARRSRRESVGPFPAMPAGPPVAPSAWGPPPGIPAPRPGKQTDVPEPPRPATPGAEHPPD